MSEHVLEPAAQAFADATATPPFIYQLGVEGARKLLDDVQAAPVEKPEVDEKWITVPTKTARTSATSGSGSSSRWAPPPPRPPPARRRASCPPSSTSTAAAGSSAARPPTTGSCATWPSASAWRTTPSWFVFGSADRNIPAELIRFMADRAGARASTEIPGGSHAISVSHPVTVAETILAAVEATKQ